MILSSSTMALALWTRRTGTTTSSWRQRRKGLTSWPTSNTYQEFVAVGNQVLECPACPLSSLLGTHVGTFSRPNSCSDSLGIAVLCRRLFTARTAPSVLSTPSDVTPRSNWGDNNWTLLFLSSDANTCATRCYANDWKDVFAMPSSGLFALAVPRH